MAEKKRKGTSAAAAPPMKKSKTSTMSEPAIPTVSEPEQTTTGSNGAVKASNGTPRKRTRKQAADFLDDIETQSAPTLTSVAEASKPTKKSKKSAPESPVLSTSRQPQEEPSAPSDSEVEGGEWAAASDEEDQGAVLLAGFDSDNDDPVEDQGDLTKTQPIPHSRETNKKLKQAKEKGSDGPGAVYVGRIPHGFYEHQMRDYFTQFGNITRLRLSRNKKTGASKHFAFVEFESNEVAKIVADTMDNYLMFGHILKCKYAPSEQLHPDVWKGANKKFRKIPHEKIQRQQLEAPKTQDQWEKKNEREQKKRQQKAEKMKAIGYEYIVPKLADPADVIEQKTVEQQKDAEQAHGIPQVANSDVPDKIEAPPPLSVPADEVALKKEKKSSKKRKSSGVRELLTEGNLDAKNAGPAAEFEKVAEDEADKASNIATKDTDRKVNAVERAKKPKKNEKAAAGSTITGSSHNQYDDLSSIGVGIEAAPAYVTDADHVPDLDPQAEELDSIATEAGVADAVLKGRKRDRRKVKQAGKSTREKAEKEVSDLAPGATRRGREEKEQKQKKKARGVPKEA